VEWGGEDGFKKVDGCSHRRFLFLPAFVRHRQFKELQYLSHVVPDTPE
jgi:hypothetical protein